jgi:hypothetical protein
MKSKHSDQKARDPHEILGVPIGADRPTIDKAYRKLAMKFHPDRNPGDMVAEARFKEASDAYGKLTGKDAGTNPIEKGARDIIRRTLEAVVIDIVFKGDTLVGKDLPHLVRYRLSEVLKNSRTTKYSMERSIREIEATAGKFSGGCADLLEEQMQFHILLKAKSTLEFTIEVISMLEEALKIMRECKQSGVNPFDNGYNRGFFSTGISFRE